MSSKLNEYDWLKCEGESTLWFSRFVAYYLPASFPTSYTKHSPLLSAYRSFLEDRVTAGDKAAAKILARPGLYPDENWVTAAKDFNWERRAKEFFARQVASRLKVKKDRLFDTIDIKFDTIQKTSKLIQGLIEKGQKYVDPDYDFQNEQGYRAVCVAVNSLVQAGINNTQELSALSGMTQILDEQEKIQEKQISTYTVNE